MNKIEALEKTLFNVKNDVITYNWKDQDSCNCGILARSITGKHVDDTGFDDMESKRPFSRRLRHIGCNAYSLFSDRTHCLSSNLPLPYVFQSLRDAGFTPEEMYHLEFLNDKKILKRVGRKLRKSVKWNLVQYLAAWIEILKAEEKQDKGKTVYVSIPEKIKKEGKELITNN